ncbi:hypothetical protein KJ980_05400 [Patescibacteria group bacterium]|nr:hypothetical protein [Patescibacteria group bacterium]MBU4016373.1 hypothetical protein [Patescibacteria group bacterium]MBU4099056.1 hypothetical protein [Patescibacteria group bacterium]
MAQKVNLIYKLEGEFEDGIDVKEISPVLLALGELIQEGNTILNPSGRELSVKVKPFKEGSFEVDIFVFALNNYRQIIDAISQDGVRDVKELLEWIGIIIGGTVTGTVSLVKLMQFLKGKPSKTDKIERNKIQVFDSEGNSVITDTKVYALFSSPTIQQNVYNVIYKPSNIPNFKEITTSLKDQEESKNTITKEDAKDFEAYATPVEVDGAEIINESTAVYFLKPKQGSYEGNKGPYSFRIPGSNDTLSKVTILDEDFANKLERGEIRLHKTDTIKAEVHMVQKKIHDRFTPPQYEILRVVSYEKPNINQEELFNDEKEED